MSIPHANFWPDAKQGKRLKDTHVAAIPCRHIQYSLGTDRKDAPFLTGKESL